MLKLPHTHLDSVNALPMLRAGRVFCFLTRLLPRQIIDAFALGLRVLLKFRLSFGSNYGVRSVLTATVPQYVPKTPISAVAAL